MNRNIGLCIVFSVITCGIYAIYWFYKLTEDTNNLSGDNKTSPGMAVLFSLITCGIYTLYWSYKMGKQIAIAEANHGMPSNDESILYLILSVFGLSIVVYAILQSNINKMVPAIQWWKLIWKLKDFYFSLFLF